MENANFLINIKIDVQYIHFGGWNASKIPLAALF
jgi:hypothetical protein